MSRATTRRGGAQLAEIDENLMRTELSATEYAEHVQRRKEVWEAMRAQEQPGGSSCATRSESGQFTEGNDGGGQGFAEATAEATGKSKASTNRATKRAREVCQQARDIIRDHPPRHSPSFTNCRVCGDRHRSATGYHPSTHRSLR